MTSSESKEPKGSEHSSSELFAPGDEGAIERVRSVLESEAVVGRSALEYRGLITSALMEPEKPELRCTCGCRRGDHFGRPRACIPHGFHEFVCDHTRCGWKPREEEPERKKCGYSEHGFKPMQGYKDEPGKPHCITCGHVWGECNWHWVEGDPPCEEPHREGCGHTEGEGCGCPPGPPCNCDPVRELDGYTYKSAHLHAAGCPLGQQPEEPPLTPEEEEEAPGYEELAREDRIRDAAERVATSSEGLNRRLEPHDGPPPSGEKEELSKDAALLVNPGLQESLSQLRRGETEPALTQEEEEEPSDPDACDHQCQCEHDHWDHSSFGYCKQCDCGSSSGHYPSECPEASDDTDLSEEDVDRMMAEGEPVALEGPPCSEVEGCDGNCCAKAPPQPERRPPYLVAYSVQGHLYEVALPGDAMVRAVDGALVIQHHLGAVNGIVQVLPVINKESNGADTADR